MDVLPSLFPPSTLHHRPGFRPSLSLSQDGTAETALSSFDLAPTTAFPLGWGGDNSFGSHHGHMYYLLYCTVQYGCGDVYVYCGARSEMRGWGSQFHAPWPCDRNPNSGFRAGANFSNLRNQFTGCAVMGTGILSSPALVLSAGLNPARGFSPAPHLANL